MLSFPLRLSINATILWVVGSTFWYSCVWKQVCLPDAPPEGLTFSLDLPALNPPPQAAPAPTAADLRNFDKPLGFAWSGADPVQGSKFSAFRDELLKREPEGLTLEITGTSFAGERNAGDLGLARAERVRALFGNRVSAGRIKIASRANERTSAEQRAPLFEAVSVRWLAPGARDVVVPPVTVAQAAAAPAAQPIVASTPADVAQTKILIYFATGTDAQSVDPDVLSQLRALAEAAQRDGRVVVMVGHTDSQGDEALNVTLGLTRATRVRDYLASAVNPLPRVELRSEGPKQPIAPNDTEEGRAKNRRVEVFVR